MPAFKVYKKPAHFASIKEPAVPLRRKRQRRQITKIAKNVFVNMAEKKYFDYTNTHSLSSTWGLTAICTPSQVAGDSGRDGDEILQKSLMLHASFVGQDSTNVIRLVVIRWLADGNPTAANIFSDDTTVYSPLSMYRHDDRKLFNVIYDSGLIGLANAAGGKLHATRSTSKSLSLYHQQFSGGTTNNVKGGLYMFYVSDSIAVGHPTLVVRTRVHYLDP